MSLDYQTEIALPLTLLAGSATALRWCCMWSCSDLQCKVILGWLG